MPTAGFDLNYCHAVLAEMVLQCPVSSRLKLCGAVLWAATENFPLNCPVCVPTLMNGQPLEKPNESNIHDLFVGSRDRRWNVFTDGRWYIEGSSKRLRHCSLWSLGEKGLGGLSRAKPNW